MNQRFSQEYYIFSVTVSKTLHMIFWENNIVEYLSELIRFLKDFEEGYPLGKLFADPRPFKKEYNRFKKALKNYHEYFEEFIGTFLDETGKLIVQKTPSRLDREFEKFIEVLRRSEKDITSRFIHLQGMLADEIIPDKVRGYSRKK